HRQRGRVRQRRRVQRGDGVAGTQGDAGALPQVSPVLRPQHALSDAAHAAQPQHNWANVLIPVDFGDWPGRIVFGAGAVGRLAELVGRVGSRRALVLCGATVAGGEMLVKVKAGLGNTLAAVFPEVQSHTPIEMVARALEQFHMSGADVIVTVGGGSAIDAGKAIAVMPATAGDLLPSPLPYPPGGQL